MWNPSLLLLLLLRFHPTFATRSLTLTNDFDSAVPCIWAANSEQPARHFFIWEHTQPKIIQILDSPRFVLILLVFLPRPLFIVIRDESLASVGTPIYARIGTLDFSLVYDITYKQVLQWEHYLHPVCPTAAALLQVHSPALPLLINWASLPLYVERQNGNLLFQHLYYQANGHQPVDLNTLYQSISDGHNHQQLDLNSLHQRIINDLLQSIDGELQGALIQYLQQGVQQQQQQQQQQKP